MVKKTGSNEKKTEYTLEEKLMSVAAAAWGMSRNMPHEKYIQNYNKLLEDTGLGGLKVNYKSEKKKVSSKTKKVSKVKKEEDKRKITKQRRLNNH